MVVQGGGNMLSERLNSTRPPRSVESGRNNVPDAMTKTAADHWFEQVWEHREETLYPSLFGQIRRGTFPIQAEMFTGLFKQETIDPRWLHSGVIEFAPIPARNSWLYGTSGMSNDWEADRLDPATPSGLGCEFVLESPQQAEWPITRLLHVMCFQILLCHGRYRDRTRLADFDRIPLRGPIGPTPSALTRLMLAPPSGFPRVAELQSGDFDFYQLVGISDEEATFARTHGGPALLKLLSAHGYFPITDPDRDDLASALA